MANGDLIKLGTLYLGNAKKTKPTRPWRTDTTPPGASSVGDITSFSTGQTIEIRDTDSVDAYKLQWREVNVDGKKLLVADRNLLVNVSWDDLNAQSLVFGKTINIDGQQYKIRLLTGGTNYRNGDHYAGGTPSNNEWDRIIANESSIQGLPIPAASDLDSSQNSTDFNSAHNKFWNWFYCYSWVQETQVSNSSYRVLRGNTSARYLTWTTQSHRNAGHGWRPALEVLNSAPLISGTDENLGNKSSPFSVIYTVSDFEGDAVDVVEKINGVTIRSSDAVEQGVNREIVLDLTRWSALALNQASTITIEATDSKGSKSTRTYTFTKTNSAPTVNVVEPKGNLAEIAITDTVTPILVWSFVDADPGDSQSAYQVLIEDTFGNTVHDSTKKMSSQSFYQVSSSLLQWGTKYKWKVKVWDKFDVSSNYSFEEFFLPNRKPDVTNLSPGSMDVNTPAGAGVTPEFSWTFDDLDLEAQNGYQLQIHRVSDDVLVYNSNRINRNVQSHQVPSGALSQGVVYYAILTVWDPNNLSDSTDKIYFRTNATPTAPLLTGPINNYRTNTSPTFQAIVGTDSENDKQHFVVQLAEDVNFTIGVLEFSSLIDRAGWKVNGYDIPDEGVDNSAQGRTVSYTTQIALAKNKTYFWRMAAIDTSTTARGNYSEIRKIRCGNKLEFQTKTPIATGKVAARRILTAMDYELPGDGNVKASLMVEVSNNALDVNPTWEDATAQFLSMDYYNFANAEKTATEFAIAVRVTIEANDSLEPIYVDALGVTFD